MKKNIIKLDVEIQKIPEPNGKLIKAMVFTGQIKSRKIVKVIRNDGSSKINKKHYDDFIKAFIKELYRTYVFDAIEIFKKGFDTTSMNYKRPILPEDFDIEIAAESREILSEALEAQRSKENLAQLANYMVDPADKQKVAQHPAPYWGR